MNDPLDFSHWENAAEQQQKRRGGLNLRFYSEAIENKMKSEAAGRPIYDMHDFVAINVPGSRDEFVQRMNAEAIQKYGPQYEMWKKTQEQPTTGTPLSMVPFLNMAQVKEFNALNVMSLEQLAELSDMATQKCGMGAVEARKKAIAYMASAKDNAVLTRVMSENERLRADLAAQGQQIAQLTARIETLMAGGGGPALHPSAVVPANGPTASGDAIRALIQEELKRMMTQ